jgi:hypothetical protein
MVLSRQNKNSVSHLSRSEKYMATTVKLRHADFKRGVEDVLKLRPILKAVRSVAEALKSGKLESVSKSDMGPKKEEAGSSVRRK